MMACDDGVRSILDTMELCAGVGLVGLPFAITSSAAYTDLLHLGHFAAPPNFGMVGLKKVATRQTKYHSCAIIRHYFWAPRNLFDYLLTLTLFVNLDAMPRLSEALKHNLTHDPAIPRRCMQLLSREMESALHPNTFMSQGWRFMPKVSSGIFACGAPQFFRLRRKTPPPIFLKVHLSRSYAHWDFLCQRGLGCRAGWNQFFLLYYQRVKKSHPTLLER